MSTSGLCEHHTAHDETCGYAPTVENHACSYECLDCTEQTETSADAAAASVCTCESDDPAYHAPFCERYVALENPECFCAEKCTADIVNEWCDVCYFGIEGCTDTDTAAVYNRDDDMKNLYLGDIKIVSDYEIQASGGDN